MPRKYESSNLIRYTDITLAPLTEITNFRLIRGERYLVKVEVGQKEVIVSDCTIYKCKRVIKCEVDNT